MKKLLHNKYFKAIGYTILLLITLSFLKGCVNGMFYYPSKDVRGTPESYKLTYEEVSFKSTDGTTLTGWFVPAIGCVTKCSPPWSELPRGTAKGTVIHFHGNAENISNHFAFVSWLPAEGFNVFTFDYRGYGKSEGKPKREGVYQDCMAALEYITKRPDINPDKIVLLGQSLGGANAVAIMNEPCARKVRAIAVDSAFYSYRLIVRDKIRQIPILSILRWPLSFLIVSNSRSPEYAIDKISPIPILIIHGTKDEVVPYRHGQMLFDSAKEPKEFITVGNGMHTDALGYNTVYQKRLLDFYLKALDSEQAKSPISLSLALIDKDSNIPIKDRRISVTLYNIGDEEINIDQRLLNLVLLIKIMDLSGQIIPPIPPSIPRPPNKDDVIPLKPGDKKEIIFTLARLTVVDLHGKKILLSCSYNTNYPEYDGRSLNLWVGEADSNILTIE
jgi:fermentation-respiration switch protein FrsA (DUF1100 family)